MKDKLYVTEFDGYAFFEEITGVAGEESTETINFAVASKRPWVKKRGCCVPPRKFPTDCANENKETI